MYLLLPWLPIVTHLVLGLNVKVRRSFEKEVTQMLYFMQIFVDNSIDNTHYMW